MGIKVRGIDAVTFMLDNISAKTNKRALHAMRDGAEDIVNLARDYAPVDKGNLEKAIDVEGEDRGGMNRRTRIFVSIDEEAAIPDRPGKRVGDYAVWAHEGSYELGEKSQAKANATGKEVGPKFLERAAEELEPEITAAVEAALDGLL